VGVLSKDCMNYCDGCKSVPGSVLGKGCGIRSVCPLVLCKPRKTLELFLLFHFFLFFSFFFKLP